MKSKILNLTDLLDTLKPIRKPGIGVVFTNGCFDILHAGHVRYLNAAKAFGDILIVGLNSDESVRSIKGSKRPVVSQEYRAEVLAGLMAVDYITIFNQPDPFTLIQAIMPDILVKGADWTEDAIIGADMVKRSGGRVERIQMVPDISTTTIIERIIKAYAGSDGKNTIT